MLAISNMSKQEGNSKTTVFTFTVTLSAAYGRAVTTSSRTPDGTATTTGVSPDDIARTGTLTFNPGEMSKTISMTVKGDRNQEADETFSLDLLDKQHVAVPRPRHDPERRLNASRGPGAA